MTDQSAAVATPRSSEWLGGDTTGKVHTWKQLVFPAAFLVYLVQTVDGVFKHSSGIGIVIGLLLVPAFCACYLGAMVIGRNHGGPRSFWYCYYGMLAVTALEAVFAHQDAFVMLVYVGVMTVAAGWLRGIPIIVGYCLIATFVPVWIWDVKLDLSTAAAIAIITLAMFGFFAVIRSNAALAQARSEVARLATENERARIARDLHDLLGHSLTTITVKAQLAHRLSAADPARAAIEIGEVEELSRRTLADVRAAVSGYREVTLGNELAAAREVLRAAGISADLPGAIDSVTQPDDELFAWVVREGVTNVVRHSRASRCQVVLGPRSIEICDDGSGADADNPGQRTFGFAGKGFRGRRGSRHRTGRGRAGLAVAGRTGGIGMTIRLLLADDQAMVRSALAALLSMEDDFEVVAEVGRGDEVVAAAVKHRPDVALLDIEMPGLDGLAAAAALAHELPELRVDHPDHLRPARLSAPGDGIRRARVRGQGRPGRTAGRGRPPGRRWAAGGRPVAGGGHAGRWCFAADRAGAGRSGRIAGWGHRGRHRPQAVPVRGDRPQLSLGRHCQDRRPEPGGSVQRSRWPRLALGTHPFVSGQLRVEWAPFTAHSRPNCPLAG